MPFPLAMIIVDEVYVPAFNRIEGRAKTSAFIHGYGFATVITFSADELDAS